MKILVWGLSIPWVLMLNTSAHPAEQISADRMMRNLNVAISLIETKLQVQESSQTPFAFSILELQESGLESSEAKPFPQAPFTPLFKDLNTEIEPRAPAK